ncbi:MAG: YkgJ family cysteine cluster protein [Bacteroidota bacterium]
MQEIFQEWKAKKEAVKKQNRKFIKKLSGHAGKRLNAYADELHEKAFSTINCLDCANCCSSIPPIVNNTDAARIAKYLGMGVSEFEATYLKVDEDKDKVMQATPCPFLQEDKTCKIYEVRPKACRAYPHTDQQEFSKNLHLHVENAYYCPAVYNILETMKKNIPV